MDENEVIIVDGINKTTYTEIIDDAVNYAIISIPFTVNRMNLNGLKSRILNTAKGKIAEGLFKAFCSANNIPVNFNACQTPFYDVDRRDFLLDQYEWDIKNNFYHCDNTIYNGNFTEFPALVPNRFTGDQWSKKDDVINNNSIGVRFLFTFLKLDDLNSTLSFIDIDISPEQEEYLMGLVNKYKGNPQQNAPYSEDSFWNKFNSLGGNVKKKIFFYPDLVITGYAGDGQWDNFSNTGPNNRDNAFEKYIMPEWYHKSKSGALFFLNGTLRTKITNMTVPVSYLPSFLSLYPQLKQNIKLGHIK